MHKKIRAIPLPTSTGKLVIGPLPNTTPTVLAWHGYVMTGSGSAIVTDANGTTVDYVKATTSQQYTHPIEAPGPFTVTVTGTVAGSAYIG